jgi:protein O-GlcNAc transferase
MAASMLHPVGLSELTTSSVEEYERIALKLAHNPALLTTVKDKLARNRNTLFKTERATPQIESAYTMMWERYRGGAVSDKSKPVCIA